MISFSTQAYWATLLRFIRVPLIQAPLVLLTILILETALLAQENVSYRGVWQTETPNNGTLILILKRNNFASYFWADNADRTVYKGTWRNNDDGALLEWNDGSTHRITLNASGSPVVICFDAAQNNRYTSLAQQLPEEILGQWASAPSRSSDATSDRANAKGFFGTWKIGEGANVFYMVVAPDRSAAIDWPQNDTDSDGSCGSWAKQGSELHIAWDSGHYSILRQDEGCYTLRLIKPGVLIESDAADGFSASRTTHSPESSKWLTDYIAGNSEHFSGNLFASPKDVNSFYRGRWLVQRDANKFERIEMGRFGGLKTSADPDLSGDWRISGQDVFMQWDNGMRKLLSPVGRGFLLYEYKVGRPIDGVPTRVLSATPEDPEKFAGHFKNRTESARQLLNHAKAAGVLSAPERSVWSQTFARWMWPFSDSTEIGQPSDSLVQTNYESSKHSDPWWWPLWSEHHSVGPMTETNEERNMVEIATNANTSESKNISSDTEELSTVRIIKKPDWEWPF